MLLSPWGQYFCQKDGVAMGSIVAPYLGNLFLSQYDDTVKKSQPFSIVTRMMYWSASREMIDKKLVEIISLHPKLKFTCERESEKKL